jgi:hypothetical protein
MAIGLASIAWGLVPAAAAPPSADPATAADVAASWLARQVTDQGFIPVAGSPTTPNLSNSAQAVLALEAAGVGRTQVDALIGLLSQHVDDFVVRSGIDDPGSLSYLILGAIGAGDSPTDYGATHADLVARLVATQQPSGLFGADTVLRQFDGAFRQGLSLLALHAAGQANAAGADFLADQQCADGTWEPFRADTTQPCDPVDLTNFSGPDTNSTAIAALGLFAQGRTAPAAAGAAALDGVRNADGAWGFLADPSQATDADSTGLVTAALRTINGAPDAAGVAALLSLEAGCDADPADVGGIAFQAGGAPDVLATDQALLGLAEVAFPLDDVTISPDLVTACAVATTTTTTTTTTTLAPTTTTAAIAPSTTTGELARSGSSSMLLTGVALTLIGFGGFVVQLATDRRRRTT